MAVGSRSLALGAVAGPILLTLAWIVLGLLVPATHTEYGVQGGIVGTITSPISGLGVGPHGLLFNGAFVVSGLLTAVGVVGVFATLDEGGRSTARWLNAFLLVLSPLGFVVAGIFTLARSIPLHTIGFLLVVATPLVSFPTAGAFFRRIPTWRRFGSRLLLGAPLTLVLLVFFVLTFDQETIAAGHGVAGVPSRLLALELGAWYVFMGWRTLRRPRPAA